MSELAQVQGNTVEQELVAVRDITVNTARSMVIKDAPSYEAASKFLIEIKRRARQVADYWKPAKDMAKAAHQEICDREKAMLNPLSDAEMAIKGNMGTYLAAEQKKRLAAEAEARRQQQEERDRLLAEAVKSEKTGDAVGVEMNMAMAGMVEGHARSGGRCSSEGGRHQHPDGLEGAGDCTRIGSCHVERVPDQAGRHGHAQPDRQAHEGYGGYPRR